MQGTHAITAFAELHNYYADLNISLAYGGIVFWQSILDVLLRVLSCQLSVSSRYACKNDSIRIIVMWIVPNHDCHSWHSCSVPVTVCAIIFRILL